MVAISATRSSWYAASISSMETDNPGPQTLLDVGIHGGDPQGELFQIGPRQPTGGQLAFEHLGSAATSYQGVSSPLRFEVESKKEPALFEITVFNLESNPRVEQP